MKTAIKRLRLKQGDILVVKDYDTMEALSQIEGLKFDVSIVIAPNGTKRVNREYLEKLLVKSA